MIKENEAKVRKREASHKVRTPEEIERAEAIRLQQLKDYHKKRRAKLKEQRETAASKDYLQGVTHIDRKPDKRIVDL